MIDYFGSLECGFFAPHGIMPTPKGISSVFPQFSDCGFIPTTIPTFKIDPNTGITNSPLLQLTTEDKSWEITFEPNRVLIRAIGDDKGQICPTHEFIEKSIVYLRKVHVISPIQGSRLSFVTRGLHKDIGTDRLLTIHKNIFKALIPEDFPIPSEWSTRQVTKKELCINKKNEVLNIVLDINRVKGFLSSAATKKEFDGIDFTFDINTQHDSQKQRFDPDDAEVFLKHSFDIKEHIEHFWDSKVIPGDGQ